MFRLLIADDEPLITDGLHDRLLGLDVPDLEIYKAYSGSEAAQWVQKRRMDLVITDIKMPGMDGISLLRRVRELWPRCRVMLLTGHDEFELVYQAIQYPGTSYLLKSEGLDAVMDRARRMLREVAEQRAQSLALERLDAQLKPDLSALRREWLFGLLHDAPPPGGDETAELALPFEPQKPVHLLLGCAWDAAGRSAARDFLVADAALQAQLGPGFHALGTCSRAYMAWLVQEIEAQAPAMARARSALKSWLMDTLGDVQTRCLHGFGLSVALAMEMDVGWQDVSDACLRLRARIADTYRQDMPAVSVHSADAAGAPAPTQDERAVRRLLQSLSAAETMLEQGRQEEFEALLAQAEALLGGADCGGAVFLQVYCSFALPLLACYNRAQAQRPSADAGACLLPRLRTFQSAGQAFSALRDAAAALFELDSRRRKEHTDEAVRIIRTLVEEEPAGDLSLTELADRVYYNPQYLSRLYKQATGENLSDYIYGVRLRKACQMLEHSTHRIHEVAQAVGYASASYFTRFFKKATGMTPQEYRLARQMRQDRP